MSGLSTTLSISRLRTMAVDVPMRRPLGTSAETIRSAPLLLIDVETREGVVGHAYLFCYLRAVALSLPPLFDEAARVIGGEPLVPARIAERLARRFRLIGARGPIAMVLGGIDVACWDALAIAAGLPLARLLGGEPRPTPAYESNGLGRMRPEAAADEAEELLESSCRALKIRLGHGSLEDDLAAVRAVRHRLPDDVALMADYNQALTVAEALRRGRALDAEGLAWIEEPIRHDDYAGSAGLAAALRTPIQIGENFAGPRAMAEAFAHRASDLVMPDLERIGGVTGWMQAASLAASAGVEMSSHLYPEVSAHLLAVTPTRHWLEFVDWAAPILERPLELAGGAALVPDRPGTGVTWNSEALERHRIAGPFEHPTGG
jgi:mandelate racemase